MSLITMPASKLLSISDGDTPEIKMGVRMLGIDAPELHFPEGRDVAQQDAVLAGLLKLAAWKALPKELQCYLAPKLDKAGSLEKAWGLKAKAAFEAMVADGLAIKGSKAKRTMFFALPPVPFDCYGRILAYVGPNVPKSERGDSPPPDTFNLKMLQGGWAALCLHKENLPKKSDLDLVVAAATNARSKKLGAWADEAKLLLGYEFRSVVRLATGQKGFTYPVLDVRHLDAKPLAPEAYIEIPPEYRVFVG
jgi:endonuclease YncB( thermonuclease family)